MLGHRALRAYQNRPLMPMGALLPEELQVLQKEPLLLQGTQSLE